MNLNEFQEAHRAWSQRNFPNESWQDVLMGVVEEVGELHHHLLKQKSGIRGTWESHEAKAQDSVGDIIAYLTHVCTLRGWNLQQILDDVAQEIFSRDWKADPLNGVTATEAIQSE